MLRTNLQFVNVDSASKVFVVTSSVPNEGKTTTATNLAITLAQAGQRVLLIEADLRRPKISEYLGIEGGAGLTDVLVGRATGQPPGRRSPAVRRSARRRRRGRDAHAVHGGGRAHDAGLEQDVGAMPTDWIERSPGASSVAIRRMSRAASSGVLVAR